MIRYTLRALAVQWRAWSGTLMVLAFAAASMVGGLLGGPLTKRASASTLTTAFGVLLLGVCVVTAYDLLSA